MLLVRQFITSYKLATESKVRTCMYIIVMGVTEVSIRL